MNRKVYCALMVILSVIVIGCILYLSIYYFSNSKADKEQKALAEYIEEEEGSTADGSGGASGDDGSVIQGKYRRLYEMNPDFAGWLQIPDTKIDYGVMLCEEDEEFYIRRDFNKEHSMAGMLFIDSDSDIVTPGTNIIIYGHNMKAGTMFHDLLKYVDEEYYQEHRYVTFNTIYRDGTYEVIGAFYTQIETEDSDEYRYYRFFQADSREEFDTYVNYVKAKTPYETAGAEFGDELITLSTCSYHTDNGRYVVVAKRVIDE